jgi:hypothetical protein
MQKFIAQSNIDHFLKLIENEPDPTRRMVLEELLAEERAKLTMLETRQGSATPNRSDAGPLHDARDAPDTAGGGRGRSAGNRAAP